jgi:hypothetical protein
MSDIGALALVKYDYTDKSGWKVRPGLITGEYLNDYQMTFITKSVFYGALIKQRAVFAK